jgi:hypothetical protein
MGIFVPPEFNFHLQATGIAKAMPSGTDAPVFS